MSFVDFRIFGGMALAVGVFVPGFAMAGGNPVLDLLSAQSIVRSVINGDLPLPPTPSARGELAAAPEELVVSPEVPPVALTAAPPAKVEFHYDDVQPMVDEPTIVEDHTAAGPPPISIVEPMAMQIESAPVMPPVVVSNPTVDPFFGGVIQLLGARPDQPFLPLDAIRPPAPPQVINNQPMIVAPTGSDVTPMASLPPLPDGDVLDIGTRQAGNAPGRGVLLTDGRALLLPNVEWHDELVRLQLPQLKINQPTPARVFIARADGVVIDYIDFMLVPRGT